MDCFHMDIFGMQSRKKVRFYARRSCYCSLFSVSSRDMLKSDMLEDLG